MLVIAVIGSLTLGMHLSAIPSLRDVTALFAWGDADRTRVPVDHTDPRTAGTPQIVAGPKIVAGDASVGDQFGWSVDLDGDTVIVGAPSLDGTGSDSGAAYVFVRSGDTWVQQAKLTASDAAESDSFGWSVALDGNTALIGAIGDDSSTGAVYVFVRSGTTWAQQARLVAADAMTTAQFGHAVALDGNTALIGAQFDSEAGNRAGAVYVFVRTGTTWTQQAKLLPSDPVDFGLFGWSVALDGNTALVGAIFNDKDIFSFATGAAYVFARSGGVWSEQAKLAAGDTGTFDRFGSAVALEGNIAVVGARTSNASGMDSGAAYVFARTGGGWSEQTRLVAGDAASFDEFGESVALNGTTIIAGAPSKNGATGAAYVFALDDAGWTQQARLTAGDGNPSDEFGQSVALNDTTAFVGAPFNDVPLSDAGAAYAYEIIARGTIIIEKAADPADGTSFDFTGDLGAFRLQAGERQVFTDVPAGRYDVMEVLTPGWDLAGVVCRGGDTEPLPDGATIVLDPEETVTCTFTNVPQEASITIAKAADPADGTPFAFAGDLGAFSLQAGERQVFADLAPGTYAVTELVPAGWDLADISCRSDMDVGVAIDRDAATITVDLGSGEDITCTFTNEEEEPTAVTLVSFTATVDDSNRVVLAWETATEVDNAGFNLYRATEPGGPWTQINPELIPAEGGILTGASYRYVDTPGAGTFFYRLEDIDFNGVSTFHGPVRVQVQSQAAVAQELALSPRIYLPVVIRD